MSQPTPYTPTTDFSQQEANNASGRSTVNTAALDAEFANIDTTLDQTLANIQLIQRDDGKLADLVTQLHTLSPEVLNLMGGFRITGLWVASTDYAIDDIATYDIYTYVCQSAHTSGLTFDGQYWKQFGFSGGGDATQAAAEAQASANDAASSALSASNSASTASGHATTATTQAGLASASAIAADASADAAVISETNAVNAASAAAIAAANLPNATTAGPNKFLQSNPTGTAWDYKTASQARSSLGLAIGSDVQAYDVDTAKTDVGNVWTVDQTLGAGRSLVFEGTTDDAYEGVLSSADVTNDRTWTLPDKSGTVAMISDISANSRFTSSDQTITAGGTLTIAHGLGVVPFAVNVFLKCTVADSGYSVNDILLYSNIGQASSSAADNYGYSATINSTNISIKFGSAATSTLIAINKTTGIATTLLNTSWNLIVKAEA